MKKVSFGSKPRGERMSPDEWIEDKIASEPMKRLTIDVPLALHKCIKSECATQGLVMADVIRKLLAHRFHSDVNSESLDTKLEAI